MNLSFKNEKYRNFIIGEVAWYLGTPEKERRFRQERIHTKKIGDHWIRKIEIQLCQINILIRRSKNGIFNDKLMQGT